MVQGDNLNSRNDNKRCLTLDFKQPKRICKIQDKQQSPDWASSLALTTPELDDKALQLACQLDLLNGLPTPTTTSFLLSSPCTSTNGTFCLARSGNDALDNKPASSLTPTTDIERHLEQFQSLQTPLFEPIRDILTHSIPNSPIDSQQTNITTTTSSCNENIALSANNYQHQNNKDHRETDHHSESITDKQSNSSCPTTNIINTNINQRTDNQLQDNCNTADVLLPTPLFELDNDESEKNESCNGPSAAKRQCETRSHSEASTEDHMNHLMRHQNNQQNHNNSENDTLNVNIPLSVRRISDQSCSSSMDSSYSPKFLSLDQYPDNNSRRQQQQQQHQQQQQQQPYLLLATDGNIFSSSPNQLNSMMDNQDKMKIERKRERNRLAASKCRKRKIDRITQLEEQVADLEERLKRANNELIRHKIRMAP